nr:beta-glucan synthesis-associated protein kre6 [Quercus suber]
MSSPARPTPSRSSSSRHSLYHDASDDRQLQQAGRSSTNLAAQNSARSLREQARPNLLRKKSRPQTAQEQQEQQQQQPPPPPPAIAVQAVGGEAVTPSQSMPPIQGASTRQHVEPLARASPVARVETPSTSTRNSDEDAQSSSSVASHSHAGPASTTATAAGAALAAEMQLTPSGTGAQTPAVRMPLMQDTSYNTSTLSLTRQTTPRSVRDLGSDYTRYYNPFATRDHSYSDLASLARRNQSATHISPAVASADLHQRLSNPFHDTKRYSNPFESQPPTAPGTPRPRPPGQDEKSVATPMAVPVRSASAMSGIAMAVPMGPPSGKPETPTFIRDADPEKADFFPYLDDRLGAPDYAFPLFTDQKEDDDDMHMPQWDDDVKLKPKFKDHFTRDNLVSTLGMIFMIIGLLTVFIVLPVVSYTGTSLIGYEYETPLDQLPNPDAAQSWATVNDVKYPLLTNLRSSLIDEDTPKSAMTRKGVMGDTYNLVFSDEFNALNRTFYPGDDPYWYAFDGWYGATNDLEYYDPDAANTGKAAPPPPPPPKRLA